MCWLLRVSKSHAIIAGNILMETLVFDQLDEAV
jgi:hypothetical protein